MEFSRVTSASGRGARATECPREAELGPNSPSSISGVTTTVDDQLHSQGTLTILKQVQPSLCPSPQHKPTSSGSLSLPVVLPSPVSTPLLSPERTIPPLMQTSLSRLNHHAQQIQALNQLLQTQQVVGDTGLKLPGTAGSVLAGPRDHKVTVQMSQYRVGTVVDS